MVMYNKRYMNFLKKNLEKGKYLFLQEPLNFLMKAEKEEDEWALNMAERSLNEVIPKIETENEPEWGKELLLTYFLNLELAIYKKKDPKHTKWTIFLEKVQENHWNLIEQFVKEIDEYMSSQDDPNYVKNNLSEEKMDEFNQKYAEIIQPYIEQHLSPVDKFRAKLRITQRLNLIKRKVPLNEKMDFGHWVKEKRTALGWSLSTLAEKSGYSPAYIYRIEKGTRKNPTPQVVSKLVTALGYNPENFLQLLFEDENDSTLKNMELSDLIRLQPFTVKGNPVTDKQRQLLAEIFDLINEDDVLRVPKINQIKKKIKDYQEEMKNQ